MRGRRKTRLHRAISLPALALIFAVVFAAFFAIASTINVSTPPKLGGPTSGITGWLLEPQLCRDNGVYPTSVVTDGNGTGGDDLVIGNNKKNLLHGNGGNDCVVGGGGGDTLYGDAGTNDVCVGGGGNDKIPVGSGCEHQYG